MKHPASIGPWDLSRWPSGIRSLTPGNGRSADDRVDDPRQLAAGLGEAVEVVLARAPRLDQAAVAEQRQVVADRRLALRAQVGAKFGDVTLLLVQEHEDLEP